MLKKLVVLGTGGTIAGAATSPEDNVGYTAAQIGVQQLLDVIPSLQVALGEYLLVSEQVVQVDSKDMAATHWRALAMRANHYLALPEVRALVVTHGTDTLEETAFFLAQVLPARWLTEKPVVLTCAMRPATSLMPDGPQNMLDAVAVARSAAACGVLAVCAGTVHSARDVQKVHTYRLNAFDSGDAGPLGYVEEGSVRWVHRCTEVGAALGPIAVDQLPETDWPRVEIVMSHAGATGSIVRALLADSGSHMQPLRGIVVAGTGNGTIHEDLESSLRDAQKRGVRVLRTTRCARGNMVVAAAMSGLPHAHGLSPVKARIALMLELMLPTDAK